MTRLYLLVLVMTLCAAGVLAADPDLKYDVLPYYGYVDYHNSATKTDANLLGLYGSFSPSSTSLLEGDVEDMTILRPQIGNLHQVDSTLAYTMLIRPRLYLRLGAHYISCADELTDQGWVAFLGTDYYLKSRWNTGLDVYQSAYQDYTPDALHVTQLNPHVGFTFSRSVQPLLYGELKGYWIHTSNDVGFGMENYYSLEGDFTQNVRQWKLCESAWFGQQDHAVQNDGFIVYNLAERHTGGQRVEARYALSDTRMFIARVTREQFQEMDAPEHASSVTCLGMLRFLF